MRPRCALAPHTQCPSRASVDPSDGLSRSDPAGLFGDKPENLAFVEISVCASRLLAAGFARNPTIRTRIFLRQIAHRSPCMAAEHDNRGSTGGFKPAGFTANACQMARDCVCAYVCLLSPRSRVRALLWPQEPTRAHFSQIFLNFPRARGCCVRGQAIAREIARAAEACAACSVRKRQDGGRTEEVFTPPLTPPPPAHRCSSTSWSALEWSRRRDRRPAVTGPPFRRPSAALQGPLARRPFTRMLLGRCRGRNALFLPL